MTGTLAEALVGAMQSAIETAEQGGPIVTGGRLTSVRDDGSMTVRSRKGVSLARAATEEPLREGQFVWLARTTDGTTIIHGAQH